MTTELQAIAQSNNWSEVYELAENYRQQQQWQPAVIAYQRAITLRPDFSWSYHHLGDVLSQLGLWSEAVKTYLAAVKLNPDFFWSWHNLGTALGKLRQWSKAVQIYTQAVKLDPNFFWSWHNLADAWAGLGKWEQAIACYLQAGQLEAPHIENQHQGLYQKLGTAFKQQGSLTKSVQYYRGLIRSSQHSQQESIFGQLRREPQKLLELGENLTRVHQIFGAIIIYYLLLEIQPDQIEILSRLNHLLNEHTQLEQKITAQRTRLVERRSAAKQSSQRLIRQKSGAARELSRQGTEEKIIIKNNAAIEPQQLENLFQAVGWSDRPLEKVRLALSRSYGYICAWHIVVEQEQHKNHHQQLVGFARVVSDGVFQATLLDIVVHPHFQGQGIGKTMVERLVQQLTQAEVSDITLFASPHIVDFYHKLGFVAQPNNLQWMLWCPQN